MTTLRDDSLDDDGMQPEYDFSNAVRGKYAARVDAQLNAIVHVGSHLTIDHGRLSDFCQRWQVQELALFGSALRDDFGPESDIDLLVNFAPDTRWSLLDHIRMEQELESIFGRPVDFVTRRALEQSQNWMRRQEILSTARVIYGDQQVLIEP